MLARLKNTHHKSDFGLRAGPLNGPTLHRFGRGRQWKNLQTCQRTQEAAGLLDRDVPPIFFFRRVVGFIRQHPLPGPPTSAELLAADLCNPRALAGQ
jgi:hypothetical protein